MTQCLNDSIAQLLNEIASYLAMTNDGTYKRTTTKATVECTLLFCHVLVFVVFLVTGSCILWQLRLCHTLVLYLFMAAFEESIRKTYVGKVEVMIAKERLRHANPVKGRVSNIVYELL